MRLKKTAIESQSVSKNYLYQFVYQFFIMAIPLIVAPFLTRTLQETSIGIFAYVNSIASYFVVIANLGISRHGQRIISENANNEINLRKAFWSLFTVHCIIACITTIGYIVFLLVFVTDNKVIYIVEAIYVLSALFDITWLFYGLENFKSVVFKNAIIRVLECIFIFILIRTPDDLLIYTIINASSICIGQIVMIPQAIYAVKPIRFNMDDAKQHIKPLLFFSISVIASFMYTVFDKTLLGLLYTKESVAFYEYSNKIISIPRAIISVTGTVMFPRACRLVVVGDIQGQNKYINYSYIITAFIGMASLFGLLAIADLFSIKYYGESFAICGSIIKMMSPLVFIIGIGEIIRTQYMIPNHMDKEFNICILLNAAINIILSVLLIPIIGVYGAVVGTMSAEIFGCVYQATICRKFIRIKAIISATIPFSIIGVTMYCVLLFVQYTVGNETIIDLLLQIIIGGIVYCVLSYIYIWHFKHDIIAEFFDK